jgi:hypothetical protein
MVCHDRPFESLETGRRRPLCDQSQALEEENDSCCMPTRFDYLATRKSDPFKMRETESAKSGMPAQRC